jgi:bifunctional NMN adenylyltransferase/nudix hydrolase
VVVVLGSAEQARDPKNPFTWRERETFVRAMVDPAEHGRLHVAGVRDFHDDARWVKAVQSAVRDIVGNERSVAIVGAFKDDSSYYLSNFPGWELVSLEQMHDLDSTVLRRVLYECETFAAAQVVLAPSVPAGVLDIVRGLACFPWFERIRTEHRALEAYRRKWTNPISVTLDAVVVAREHVLLIRRGGDIGRGLWALPGGFLEPTESLYDGALRELREETSLELLPESMRLAFRGVRVFSHPGRSLRARIITHAHHFDLGRPKALPQVRAADDARHAEWVPIEGLVSMREEIFEDHALILEAFLEAN